MVMHQNLKLLMVEDSEDDAKLVSSTLRRGGYEVNSKRVETGEAMAEALARESWDVIISDYVMPGFSGLEALKLFQASGLDLPFIVVSGKIGEETAVEAMKAGAHDYIMKDNLSRLVPAVRREIAEAEVRKQRRRAAEALRRANRTLRVLSKCNQIVVRAKDESELLNQVCQAVVGLGEYIFTWVGYAQEDENKTVRPVAQAGYDDGYTALLDISWADNEKGQSIVGRVIRSGKPLVRQDILKNARIARLRDEALKRGYRSYTTLPLTSGGKTFGILNVYSGEPDAFNDDEVALLTELADDLAYGITAIRTEIAHRQAETALKVSEERYHNLVENAPVGVGFNTLDGRAIFRNQTIARMAGYDSLEEFSKIPVQERYFDPKDRERFLKLLELGPVRDFEVRLKRKDGSAFWTFLNAIFQKTETGEPGILVITQDIDARKRAEEALKTSEERYRTLVENAPVGISFSTVGGRSLFRNRMAVQMFGYDSVEELLKVPTQERYFDIRDRERLMKLLEQGPVRDFEVRLKRKDGSVFWGSSTVVPQATEVGEPGILVITQGIDERKRVEEALKASEERYRNLVENAPVGIGMTTLDGRPIFRNKSVALMHGYESAEEFMKVPTRERYYDPEDRERLMKLLEQGLVRDFEIKHKRKDGSTFWVSVTAIPQQAETGEHGVLMITQDIDARKRAEEKIRHAAEEWRATFDSITDLVSIHDKDCKIIRVNKAFANLLNMKPAEVIGKTCYQVIHGANKPVLSCPHMKTLETKKPTTSDFFEPYLGIHLEVTTAPIFNEKSEIVASVHIARDITERKKMQDQLILTDRLASIGQLVSGIAHELNNPLTSVIGFSELLLGKDLPENVKEDLTIINKEAKRSATIVRGLLTFARKQTPGKESVDINSIIQGVLQVRSYEQRVSNIEVHARFAPDLPQVIGNGAQLQQVFINIIINAEQAMLEAHGRGTLTIITERVGDIIRASVIDSGPGISRENMRKLFTPFFTTKEVGKGTGLGLSICHGIVTEHRGRIYAESELGKGASFILELPIPARGGESNDKS